MSLVDTIMAAPDAALSLSYLAQQAPGAVDTGTGGGGGQGAEGVYSILRQVGGYIKTAGIIFIAIIGVIIGIKITAGAVSNKDGGGVRAAVSSIGMVLFGSLVVGAAATAAGYAMQIGADLG